MQKQLIKTKFILLSIIIIIIYFVLGDYLNNISINYYKINPKTDCALYENASSEEIKNKFTKANKYIKYRVSLFSLTCHNKNFSSFLLDYIFYSKGVINPYNIFYTPILLPDSKIYTVNEKLSRILNTQPYPLSSNYINTEEQQISFYNYWSYIIERELKIKATKYPDIKEDVYDLHFYNFIFTFGLVVVLLVYIRKNILNE